MPLIRKTKFCKEFRLTGEYVGVPECTKSITKAAGIKNMFGRS